MEQDILLQAEEAYRAMEKEAAEATEAEEATAPIADKSIIHFPL